MMRDVLCRKLNLPWLPQGRVLDSIEDRFKISFVAPIGEPLVDVVPVH